MIKVFRVKERPLTMAELIQESGLVGNKIADEYEMKKRLDKCVCGSLSWILLPMHSKVVKEGGKRYMFCLDCGATSHL